MDKQRSLPATFHMYRSIEQTLKLMQKLGTPTKVFCTVGARIVLLSKIQTMLHRAANLCAFFPNILDRRSM
jgi:hypothetical protein